MSSDLATELSALRALIVTAKDDITHTREAYSHDALATTFTWYPTQSSLTPTKNMWDITECQNQGHDRMQYSSVNKYCLRRRMVYAKPRDRIG